MTMSAHQDQSDHSECLRICWQRIDSALQSRAWGPEEGRHLDHDETVEGLESWKPIGPKGFRPLWPQRNCRRKTLTRDLGDTKKPAFLRQKLQSGWTPESSAESQNTHQTVQVLPSQRSIAAQGPILQKALFLERGGLKDRPQSQTQHKRQRPKGNPRKRLQNQWLTQRQWPPKREASDLMLDEFPLLKNKETSHILLSGTTGAGKTNAFHTLLPQIRRRVNRAVVVDLTGDFVNRYYREGYDILLNPFDKRGALWSPWGECLDEPHYDALAAAVVAKSGTSEPFWEEAAKALLSTALKELARQGERSVGRLYDILIKENLGVFAKFFRGTEAASYAHPDGEKMTLSIRATLANALQGFRYLNDPPEGQGFAIRRWIQEEGPPDQWLFLNARPDQRETLRPLLSCWIDTSISSLMSLAPDPNRRLWFILDELPTLQKLPSLALGLAEARKYGGCMMAGVQSVSQISRTYGTNLAQTLLDLLGTKRSDLSKTAKPTSNSHALSR